jgi:hypothetical protein
VQSLTSHDDTFGRHINLAPGPTPTAMGSTTITILQLARARYGFHGFRVFRIYFLCSFVAQRRLRRVSCARVICACYGCAKPFGRLMQDVRSVCGASKGDGNAPSHCLVEGKLCYSHRGPHRTEHTLREPWQNGRCVRRQ